MNLYQIDAELQIAFESMIDPETGEITGDPAVLDNLQIARDAKIENTACYIKNLLAEAEAIKAEVKKLTALARACENHADSLKKYLAHSLQGEDFKTAKTAITWRKSEAVNITCIADIPVEYCRIKAPEPDKTAIKKALKAGEVIEGAELVTNLNMQIK